MQIQHFPYFCDRENLCHTTLHLNNNLMKIVYFWKTLLCRTLVLMTLAGCSDDSTDGNGSAPSISVNGKAEETLTVYLAGGSTRPVNVVSSGEWTLTFSDEKANTWCHPKIESNEEGSRIYFDIEPSNTGRNTTVTLTTESLLNGFLARARNTIKIVQSEGFDMATNVKSVRQAVSAIATPEGTPIRGTLSLTGIVVSDVQAGGTLGNKMTCYLADNSAEAEAGIVLRFKNAYDYVPGTVISGSLRDCKAVLTKTGLEIHPAADGDFAAVEGARRVKLLPAQVEIDDLAMYESQYVELVGVQPVRAFRGKPWHSGSESESLVKFEVETGGRFEVAVEKSAEWASDIIPAKRGAIYGIVVRDNAGNIRIAPRNKDDVNGLTEEVFIYTISSIANIVEEGSYMVNDATVLAVCEGGFLMDDATGRIYVDQYTAGTTADIPAVGAKVTVQGDVARVNGLLCYKSEGLRVEVTGEGTLPELILQQLDGPKFTASFEQPAVSYVKYMGKLVSADGDYQVVVAGTDVVGLLVHPAKDELQTLVGNPVDVIGWTIGAGYTGAAKSLMTLAVNVEEHASSEGAFTTEPQVFAGINPSPQTLSFSANEAAGEVKFSLLPDDGRFAARKLSADEVEISATGYNISGNSVTGTLLLLADDGSELDRITLEQASMAIGSTYTWTLTEDHFATNPNGSMTAGTPALPWSYTGVDKSARDLKSDRGFQFCFDNTELSTTAYEGAIKTIVLCICQTTSSKVTALMKVNGVPVAAFGNANALKAGGLDTFEGLKCSLGTKKGYVTLTIDKAQTGAGIYHLDAPLAGEITFEMHRNGGKSNQSLFIHTITVN